MLHGLKQNKWHSQHNLGSDMRFDSFPGDIFGCLDIHDGMYIEAELELGGEKHNNMCSIVCNARYFIES